MICHFLKDTKGAAAIEYALIASLVSIVVVGGFVALGSSMEGTFEYIKDSVLAIL
ncbi:MAG: Flp family type IVb pilin [Rhizobiales bacterium]|nr:Flp family type IVb pilin [Hyphomicrobiales bacterium]